EEVLEQIPPGALPLGGAAPAPPLVREPIPAVAPVPLPAAAPAPLVPDWEAPAAKPRRGGFRKPRAAGVEREVHPRQHFVSHVRCRAGNRVFVAQSADVSRGGMFIEGRPTL